MSRAVFSLCTHRIQKKAASQPKRGPLLDKMIGIRNVDPQGRDASTLLYEAFIDAKALYPELIRSDAPPPTNGPLVRGGVYVVGYEQNVALASGALQPCSEGLEVRRMYVHRDFRRRGIARKVLEHLREEAKRLGHQRLVLETGYKQIAAMRLYENFGFRRREPFGQYIGDETSVCYELVLRYGA